MFTAAGLFKKIGDRNMSDTEISEVGDCITVGFNDVATGRILLSSHLRLELQQMMSRVRPEDLSAAEITALLAILRLAHCRVIGGPTGRPGLRVVGVRGEHPAPNLA
jgi:hypothetical protein